jgi:hypothetical protein
MHSILMAKHARRGKAGLPFAADAGRLVIVFYQGGDESVDNGVDPE